MSLQHDGHDRLAGARPAGEYEPRTEQRRPTLVSRIAQVLESDVAWGVIVLGVIVTAATFAT